MLSHIGETLSSTLHLPVSSEDTLHFYQYLCTHVLIANKQFLLLINVPIQDRTQQISIYKIFTLDIPHGNLTAHSSILNISESCKMTPWQWESHHNSSEYVKKQMDSFVTFLLLCMVLLGQVHIYIYIYFFFLICICLLMYIFFIYYSRLIHLGAIALCTIHLLYLFMLKFFFFYHVSD